MSSITRVGAAGLNDIAVIQLAGLNAKYGD